MSMVSDDSIFLLRHEERSEAYEALRVLCHEERREEVLQGFLVRFELLNPEMTMQHREAVEQEARHHLLTIAHAVHRNIGLSGVLDDLGWEVACCMRRDLLLGDFGIAPYDIKQLACDKYEESLLDDFLFELLAPYIVKDSYIQCFNDEGESWRFVFDGMHCHQMQPQTTWSKRKKGVETDQERVVREWNALSRTLKEVLRVEVIGISDPQTHTITWTAFCRDQPLGKYTSMTEAYHVALQEIAKRIK